MSYRYHNAPLVRFGRKVKMSHGTMVGGVFLDGVQNCHSLSDLKYMVWVGDCADMGEYAAPDHPIWIFRDILLHSYKDSTELASLHPEFVNCAPVHDFTNVAHLVRAGMGAVHITPLALEIENIISNNLPKTVYEVSVNGGYPVIEITDAHDFAIMLLMNTNPLKTFEVIYDGDTREIAI